MATLSNIPIISQIIERAKKEYPGVPFEICDAWRTLELVQLKSKLLPDTSNVSLGYDAIYADIGGLSGSDGLLESLALLDALGYGALL